MSIQNKKIDLFFKNKSMHQLLGSYKSSFKGSGVIYKESRPYAPGDPYHRIDRQATAKKQDLYSKVFEEERMLRVLFVTHSGASMHFSSTTPTKREMIATRGSLLGTIVRQQGDQMSYFIHTSGQSRYFPLSKTPHLTRQFEAYYKTLTCKGKASAELTAFSINKYRIRHQLIIRISDQLITTPQPHLQALAKCNDLLYIHLFDPFEYDADPERFGVNLVQVGEHTQTKSLTKNTTAQYQKTFLHALNASEQLLTSWGITTTHASTEDDPFLVLINLFQKHLLKR